MKKFYFIATLISCAILALTVIYVKNSVKATLRKEVVAEVKESYQQPKNDISTEKQEPISPEDETLNLDLHMTPSEEYCGLSLSEVELIATCTMGEAEGESELGKRLVIDTILNRIDDPHFPDNARDVILQPNQFSCMWSSRIERCYPMPEIVDLVLQECRHRTNSEVIFFMAGRYSDYGTPLFQEGGHYFSKY